MFAYYVQVKKNGTVHAKITQFSGNISDVYQNDPFKNSSTKINVIGVLKNS